MPSLSRCLVFARRPAAALALALLADAAAADTLLQLTLSGRIARPGGARVELEIAVQRGSEERAVTVDAHFAQGTTASDVAALVERQLELLEATAIRGAEDDPLRGMLFVEHVNSISLRLGHGLGADVTVNQGVPSGLRFVPPETTAGRAQFRVGASTLQPHSRKRGYETLELVCEPGDSGIQVAERLVMDCIQAGWVADRPRVDTWLPIKMGDGSVFTGFSLDFRDMKSDWRVELTL